MYTIKEGRVLLAVLAMMVFFYSKCVYFRLGMSLVIMKLKTGLMIVSYLAIFVDGINTAHRTTVNSA